MDRQKTFFRHLRDILVDIPVDILLTERDMIPKEIDITMSNSSSFATDPSSIQTHVSFYFFLQSYSSRPKNALLACKLSSL